MNTNPNFPAQQRWDDEVTPSVPFVRVEYVNDMGVRFSKTIAFDEAEPIEVFTHRAKWIARQLIATHLKESK